MKSCVCVCVSMKKTGASSHIFCTIAKHVLLVHRRWVGATMHREDILGACADTADHPLETRHLKKLLKETWHNNLLHLYGGSLYSSYWALYM